MKFRLIVVGVACALMVSCAGNEDKKTETSTENETTDVAEEVYDPMTDKGVGPISSLVLEDIDQEMVVKGEEIFKIKCVACHKIDKRLVGPALKGVVDKQTPEWIMNMILNPEKMVVENKRAKELLMEYNAPMANQSLTEEEARSVLEYLRTQK